MKICENCGREYGNDNPFCPFCDERYGVVILENDVISADGLPPYKEEFPVIGETGVKLESFADNRDEIFERNIRLAASGEFLLETRSEVIYEPAVPIFKFDGNGDIIPYTPPIAPKPIVQKPVSKPKKTLNKVFKWFASVLLLFMSIVGISWIESASYDTNIQYAENIDTEKITYDAEEFYVSIPEEIIITGENGLEMKLTNGSGWELISKQNGNIIKTEKMYCFDFEFTNATDYDMRTFWNEFPNYADDVRWIYISKMGDRNVHQTIEFNDGVPNSEKSYSIHPNETAIGRIHINFNNQFDLTKH